MPDPEILSDAALMQEFRHHPAWAVLRKYLVMERENAIGRLLEWSNTDNYLRFEQGRADGLGRALGLPEWIISEAKRRS